MTPALLDLGRRAVACPRWRWMRGMSTLPGTLEEWGCTLIGHPMETTYTDRGAIPDLSDPATLGCLLALVREAWGDSTLYVRVSDTHRAIDKKVAWEVHGWLDASRSSDGRAGSWRGWGWASEAETLVAILEAAP